MNRHGPRPPRLAEALLAICLPGRGVRDSVLGDLHEMHAERAASDGRMRAAMWYWTHALRVGGAYLGRRARGLRMPGFAPTAKPGETGGDVMGDFMRDLRFALRGFVRAPGFFAVALLTLALGIGANTAIFSVVHGIYLRPLDFREPDRVVLVGQSRIDGSERMGTQTAGTFSDWRAEQSTFESFAGFRYWTTTVERGDAAQRLLSVHSLGSLFDVLGAPAMLGRTFSAHEEGPGSEHLVVLSHGFWQREYGGTDPSGSSLLVEGVPHTVLGVMPPTFRFPSPDTELWKTSDLSAEQLLDREDHFINSIGRLGTGVAVDDATREIERIHRSLRERFPEQVADTRPELQPVRDFLVGGAGTLWTTLLGAVGLLLLIACMNLANLLLSRGSARETELAVRRALGASRGRLTRQIVAESLALSLLGGAAGLGVGRLFLAGILAWMPGGIPRAEAVAIDLSVLAFTFGVAAVAGLLFGILPARQASEASLGSEIRRGGRAGGGRVRAGLVVGEIAVAVVLVTGAGLLLRGYAAVSAVEPGFDASGRTLFYVELPAEEVDTDGRDSFYRQLEEGLLALPGVQAVGVTSRYPLTGFTPGAWVGEAGEEVPRGKDTPVVRYVAVSHGYRAAAGIPLLRGRDLTDGDRRDAVPGLLLSASAAAMLFPGREALGQRVYLGPDGVVAPLSTVVGVVGDVRQSGMQSEPPPIAYVPLETVAFWRGFDVVVQASAASSSTPESVRAVTRGLRPDAIVLRPRDASGVVSRALSGQRNVLLLFGLLAGVALVLAMVGVFGVVAFLVSRRTREIGIRMAVGAGRAQVQALVLRQGLFPIGAGALLGVAAARALSSTVENLLFGVEATDPVTFLTVPVLLVGVALLAVWIPARRAAGVHPVRALTGE